MSRLARIACAALTASAAAATAAAAAEAAGAEAGGAGAGGVLGPAFLLRAQQLAAGHALLNALLGQSQPLAALLARAVPQALDVLVAGLAAAGLPHGPSPADPSAAATTAALAAVSGPAPGGGGGAGGAAGPSGSAELRAAMAAHAAGTLSALEALKHAAHSPWLRRDLASAPGLSAALDALLREESYYQARPGSCLLLLGVGWRG